MPNLDELWHYEDPIDRWAAKREFELRSRRYQRYREGLVGAVKKATEAIDAIRVAISGVK